MSAATVASAPYLGVYGAYSAASDPWKQHLPEDVLVETRQFQRDFYNKSSHYFKHSGRYTYPVQAVFVWNLASWDVNGACR